MINDEKNLIGALLAKRLGVPRVGCLAHRPQVAEIYRDLGIDMIFFVHAKLQRIEFSASHRPMK